jgi:peptidyl-prolyl cis-trans isomerase B (cyclophilin B)
VANSKRERELARMRAQRQAARRAEAQAARLKRRNSLIAGLSALAVAGVFVVIALATKDGKTNDTLTQPTPTASTSNGLCTYRQGGTPSKAVTGLPSATGPTSSKPVSVSLTTSQGVIDLSLNAANAPCTTNSFTFLAQQHYFDNTKCHRLTTAGIFVLQCGDPSASGSGGPGYTMPEENLNAFNTSSCTPQTTATTGCTVIYPRGTLAMARTPTPGSGGSQFFLVYKDSPLAPSYTPFGTITQGLAVIDKVAKGGATPVDNGKPNIPVTIKTATIQG